MSDVTTTGTTTAAVGPRPGDMVLSCHPSHMRKDGLPLLLCHPNDLRDDLQFILLQTPVRVRRIDPSTRVASEFETSAMAVCPECCRLYGNDQAMALSNARGHFAWAEKAPNGAG